MLGIGKNFVCVVLLLPSPLTPLLRVQLVPVAEERERGSPKDISPVAAAAAAEGASPPKAACRANARASRTLALNHRYTKRRIFIL